MLTIREIDFLVKQSAH